MKMRFTTEPVMLAMRDAYREKQHSTESGKQAQQVKQVWEWLLPPLTEATNQKYPELERRMATTAR